MILSFKFIPLTFLSDENEIKKQIRNTIILKYFFERNSETVHLEDLITGTQYGYNASALVHGRNKFLRISDITDGKVNWETVPYCNCTDEETYLLFPNDILIARTGGTTGKSFLISKPPALSIYAGYLIRIRANEDTNSNYLNLFLNSYVYWSQIVSLNEDNFRPSVNANKLKKLILPKCDKTIQDDAVRISNGELVKGYDELHLLIEDTLLKYDKLKEIQFEKNNQFELQKALKQSIFSEAINGKLTTKWRDVNTSIEDASKLFERIKKEKLQLIKEKKLKREKKLLPVDKHDTPFDLPVNWVWCRLGEVIINADNLNIHNELKSNELINYVDIDAIDNKKNIVRDSKLLPVNQLSSRARRVLKKGNILYSLVRPYLHNLAIIEDEKPNYIGSTGFAVFDCLFIENKYIFWLLLSKYIEDRFLEFMDGFNSPSITHEQFRSTLIPLPPIDEQKIIIKRVESLIENCQFLDSEIALSEQLSKKLMRAVLKDAFEVENIMTLDSLFEDINYNLYVAMIHKQIENRLKINYGEVATQKTVFNINAFTDQKIPYNFINSNHGTFSPQLKEDLSKNSYLAKDRKGSGEVFIINPSKQKEVLDALSNPKNKSFVRAVNEVLDIYELPFINKETDKIELLNTVAKLIIDTKSTDLEIIYAGMQKWEIKQNGFKTKAEKFSKPLTKKMIALIENLGLVNKLKKFVN
ncbi:restriction endonuclease subunit S [Flavobacterium sp.]|jgi:type I restriction enzyme S subunit|uniref:restriction endonuclease subunit S n=1 Tax=Flavobacterium sp. TaxID=239 RepID=UPI0037BF13A5